MDTPQTTHTSYSMRTLVLGIIILLTSLAVILLAYYNGLSTPAGNPDTNETSTTTTSSSSTASSSVSSSTSSTPSQPAKTVNTYLDSASGFSFEYPLSWTLTEQEGTNINDQSGKTVTFGPSGVSVVVMFQREADIDYNSGRIYTNEADYTKVMADNVEIWQPNVFGEGFAGGYSDYLYTLNERYTQPNAQPWGTIYGTLNSYVLVKGYYYVFSIQTEEQTTPALNAEISKLIGTIKWATK